MFYSNYCYLREHGHLFRLLRMLVVLVRVLALSIERSAVAIKYLRLVKFTNGAQGMPCIVRVRTLGELCA